MVSESALRIGFIGHGVHASANLYPSIQLAGARITSVATRSMKSARDAAASINADKHHDDVGVMLEKDNLDAVFISVAPENQAKIAEQCLRAGVPVFVEKPLGMNTLDAKHIAEVSATCDVPVMVGFMKRFAPAYCTLADLVADESKFGQIMLVDATFSFMPWTDELRNDTFLKLAAIHIIDLLIALFGEVTEVQGFSSSDGANLGLVYSLKFSDGHIASVNFNGVPAWARHHERITVTGTKGWAEADNLSTVRYHYRSQEPQAEVRWQAFDEQTVVVSSVNSTMSGGAQDLYQRGFVGEVQHFLDAVAENKNPYSNASDNLATMVLCERMIDAVTPQT